MNNKLDNTTFETIKNKVKICLSLLGFNEKYIAFEYLAYIISYMIIYENDSYNSFNNALDLISENYNITKTAINYGLKRITDKCLNEDIRSKNQYNLTKFGLLNRIRVIKIWTLKNFYNN